MDPMNVSVQPNVNIVEKDDYREHYANSVQVRASLWDFFLQFGTLGNQSAERVDINVFQGVYLSPQQAKALMSVLSQNLAQYEQAFGQIEIDPTKAGGTAPAIQ